MQVSGLHDVVWISCSTLIWQDHHDAATRRMGPVHVIGPRTVKGSTDETRVVSMASLHASTQEI
jgi:hypothetical protein